MSINKEKQEIIKQKGNILVTANPGTGKTLLLAHKYISLLEDGLKPEKILCLTFTDKAKREMEERIIKLIKESGISVDLSKLNIFTFHSYALNNLDSGDIISTNLLTLPEWLAYLGHKFLVLHKRSVLQHISHGL